MPKNISNTSRGFTLIELLVVIAIISLLSSVVMSSVTSARLKARDAKKQQDIKSVSVALNMYLNDHGYMPPNIAPVNSRCDGDALYDQLMQELVTDGYLAVIPKSPGGARYCLYNYGHGNAIGFVFKTTLEGSANTTTGVPPSCRPWASGTNWCDKTNDKEYCICNTW
jgi:type II secretion system protein G